MRTALRRAGAFCHAHRVGVGLAIASVVATVAPGVAGATTTTSTVSGGFTSLQSGLVTDLGYAVALVVAIAVVALGVRLLLHWGKRAVSA